MRKSKALELLGGTPAEAARRLGVTASAVSQWPDQLTREIENRVLAELARRHLPPELIGADGAPQMEGGNVP